MSIGDGEWFGNDQFGDEMEDKVSCEVRGRSKRRRDS
jgi:hypothetical protein